MHIRLTPLLVIRWQFMLISLKQTHKLQHPYLPHIHKQLEVLHRRHLFSQLRQEISKLRPILQLIRTTAPLQPQHHLIIMSPLELLRHQHMRRAAHYLLLRILHEALESTTDVRDYQSAVLELGPDVKGLLIE